MTSTNFKIGTYIGQTIITGAIEADGGLSETAVTASGGGGTSLTSYDTLDSLPTSSLTEGDRAFVLENNRFYISNGSGWYNATLVNAAPYWDSAPLAAYTIEDSATPLIVTGLALDSDNPVSYTGFASDSGQYLVNITTDSSITTFTPLSADSVANNATLGNIPDSSGGSFTYTFRATDGISVVSQVSTITYSLGIPAGYLVYEDFSSSPSNLATYSGYPDKSSADFNYGANNGTISTVSGKARVSITGTDTLFYKRIPVVSGKSYTITGDLAMGFGQNRILIYIGSSLYSTNRADFGITSSSGVFTKTFNCSVTENAYLHFQTYNDNGDPGYFDFDYLHIYEN